MTRYALNLPQQLKQEAEQLAQRQGVSLNQFIMWSVSEKVAELRHKLDDPHFPGITYRRGASGWVTPVLRGSGLRVQTIAVAVEHLGSSPEDVAQDYQVGLAQVKEALAFYQVHRAEIDANLSHEQALERQGA